MLNALKQKSGDILKQWDSCGIPQKIYDNYWIYHTERMENAYADIDNLVTSGKLAGELSDNFCKENDCIGREKLIEFIAN